MEVFTLILIAAVPVLYGLFWWLDYRWLRDRPSLEELQALDDELD